MKRGPGSLLKLLGSLANSRPHQGLVEATFQKDPLSRAHPYSSAPPAKDGKARELKGRKQKMEEVRPSYLVVTRPCPASLARSLCGLT